MRDWASELRAIADGRLMLNVRNGVTVSRSMLAMIADEIDALRAAPLAPAEVGGHADAQTKARAIVRSASPTVRKLFDAIRESGSSEPDIADAAGVSHATLHYWRAGNRSPTIMLLEAVASVLGYNIELVKADHATALAAKDAELAEVHQQYVDANEARIDAEAQLAEANKALDRIIALDSSIDATPRGERKVVYGTFAAIARRAREAQGGENV